MAKRQAPARLCVPRCQCHCTADSCSTYNNSESHAICNPARLPNTHKRKRNRSYRFIISYPPSRASSSRSTAPRANAVRTSTCCTCISPLDLTPSLTLPTPAVDAGAGVSVTAGPGLTLDLWPRGGLWAVALTLSSAWRRGSRPARDEHEGPVIESPAHSPLRLPRSTTRPGGPFKFPSSIANVVTLCDV